MATLQSTNVQGTLCVNGVAIGGGKDFYFCCFTTSGTWSPSSDLVNGNGGVEATIIGAGGGGGGGYGNCGYASAGGGGGGEVANILYKVTSTSACCRSVGAGGTRGCAGCGCSTAGVGNVTTSTKGGNSCILGNCAYGGGGGSSRAINRNGSALGGCFDTECSGNVAGGPRGGASWSASASTSNSDSFNSSPFGAGWGGNKSDRTNFRETKATGPNCEVWPYTTYISVPSVCTVNYNKGTTLEDYARARDAGTGWNGFAGGGGGGSMCGPFAGIDGSGCGFFCCSGCIPTGGTIICAGNATTCGGGGGAAGSKSTCLNGYCFRGGNGAGGLIILKWAQ